MAFGWLPVEVAALIIVVVVLVAFAGVVATLFGVIHLAQLGLAGVGGYTIWLLCCY